MRFPHVAESRPRGPLQCCPRPSTNALYCRCRTRPRPRVAFDVVEPSCASSPLRSFCVSHRSSTFVRSRCQAARSQVENATSVVRRKNDGVGAVVSSAFLTLTEKPQVPRSITSILPRWHRHSRTVSRQSIASQYCPPKPHSDITCTHRRRHSTKPPVVTPNASAHTRPVVYDLRQLPPVIVISAGWSRRLHRRYTPTRVRRARIVPCTASATVHPVDRLHRRCPMLPRSVRLAASV